MVDAALLEVVNASTCHRTDGCDRIVEKISIDSPGIAAELADFEAHSHIIESIMSLVALRNSNSNNRLAQNPCDVIERSG